MDHDRDGILADPPDQLRAYIRDGRITLVPAKRARRRLLLDQSVLLAKNLSVFV